MGPEVREEGTTREHRRERGLQRVKAALGEARNPLHTNLVILKGWVVGGSRRSHLHCRQLGRLHVKARWPLEEDKSRWAG